ncbi:hypothetical protein MUO14_11390 [Halobacillus shinanisalinarum]|uniref:Uncharacterized protein n=1 Tax=Halobacillus shinanisalinarum TaxID=2932258 RepID=A0ABY4H903_9BACI|nr:hypothetical protein [Halobacillus shinanisalinarum]UOQ95467.1 hypothetical protein MUO14_11390 [Halobacillus shinanisalinarum]
MDIVVIFMLIATVTPFIFINLKKTTFAIIQTILLVGMWVYYFQVLFIETPAMFSFSWMMFYSSLIVSEVAWVMMIIHMGKSPAKYWKNY